MRLAGGEKIGIEPLREDVDNSRLSDLNVLESDQTNGRVVKTPQSFQPLGSAKENKRQASSRQENTLLSN